jgi:hypothetical protein
LLRLPCWFERPIPRSRTCLAAWRGIAMEPPPFTSPWADRSADTAPAAAKLLSALCPLQGRIEALDQGLSAEGLVQKAYRSGLHRPRPNALFVEGCDENDRHAVTLGNQEALQLDTAHARHLNVRDHARRIVHTWRLEKICGGRKRADGEPKRAHETLRRHPNGCIIVNDRNYRAFGQNGLSFTGIDRNRKSPSSMWAKSR